MSTRRYQYKVETVKLSIWKSDPKQADELIEERVNRLAMEGWELVTVTNNTSNHPRLFLKR